MGGNLPKYLRKSEKIKSKQFQGNFSWKPISLINPDAYNHNDWITLTISVHKALIKLEHLEFTISEHITEDLILISEKTSTKIIVIGLFTKREIWLLKAEKIEDFFELTSVLTFSRVPNWIKSPICQSCYNSFSKKRAINCENCGHLVCSACMSNQTVVIATVLKDFKVCNNCESLLRNQAEFVNQYKLAKKRLSDNLFVQ
jgi:hypothetical protein